MIVADFSLVKDSSHQDGKFSASMINIFSENQTRIKPLNKSRI